MLPRLRRTVRLLRRASRSTGVLVLVLAQCISVFGYPVVVRGGEVVRQCGCKVKGPAAACCCGPRACCGGVVGQEVPEPEQPTCPKCKVKQAAKAAGSAGVTWLPAMTARSCHGDSLHGLLAEFPAIPPTLPAPSLTTPLPTDVVPIQNDQSGSRTAIPPDPPPRIS
jgi:hypothetical protein